MTLRYFSVLKYRKPLRELAWMLDILPLPLQIGKQIDWNSQFACLGVKLIKVRRNLYIIWLHCYSVNTSLSKYLVQKQNSTLGLNLPRNFHEEEWDWLEEREGWWHHQGYRDRDVAVLSGPRCMPRQQSHSAGHAVFPCSDFRHDSRGHVVSVLSNVDMHCEKIISLSFFLLIHFDPFDHAREKDLYLC